MKTCNADGCYNPVFSHGFCKNHGYLRTDKKNMPTEAKRTHRNDYSFGFDDQSGLFDWLWQNAKDARGRVYCEFTGESLNQFYNTPLYYSCFAHILSKGQYTYFKLNPANIRIVYPMFHVLADQGSHDQRAEHPEWNFEKWYAEREKLKIEYIKYKQENHLR